MPHRKKWRIYCFQQTLLHQEYGSIAPIWDWIFINSLHKCLLITTTCQILFQALRLHIELKGGKKKSKSLCLCILHCSRGRETTDNKPWVRRILKVVKCYKRKNKIKRLEVMREGGTSSLLNSHPVSLNKNDIKVKI